MIQMAVVGSCGEVLIRGYSPDLCEFGLRFDGDILFSFANALPSQSPRATNSSAPAASASGNPSLASQPNGLNGSYASPGPTNR